MLPYVALIDLPPDPAAALKRVMHPDHGASHLFVGHVRNLNDGKAVEAVTYEAHRALALKAMSEIVDEAMQSFGPGLGISLEHALGTLKVGEISILIATSHAHRDSVYRSSRMIIEAFKERVPIFKREHYVSGQAAWLEGTSLNQDVTTAP